MIEFQNINRSFGAVRAIDGINLKIERGEFVVLIGAGGLGAIMFEGLFSSAQDLVLLGVVPIVVLGVLVDAAFTAVIAVVSRKGLQRLVTA